MMSSTTTTGSAPLTSAHADVRSLGQAGERPHRAGGVQGANGVGVQGRLRVSLRDGLRPSDPATTTSKAGQ